MAWTAALLTALCSLLFSASPGLAQPARPATADFTADGSSDLVFRSAAGIGFWDLDAGVITPHYLGWADNAWAIEAMGDYNGDGTSDLLFRDGVTGAVGYWAIANGTVSAFVPLRWDTGSDWVIVSSPTHSDFNGDGRDDILWRRTNGDVGIYVLTGGQPFAFTWQPLGSFGTDWAPAGSGDFDGDGVDDILWRNLVAGTTGYFKMAGSVVAWRPLSPIDGWWWKAVVADFNGDGSDDIYWMANQAPFTWGYWILSGGEVTGFQPVAGVFDRFTRPSVVAAGDYDADGSTDVIIHEQLYPTGPPGVAHYVRYRIANGGLAGTQDLGTFSEWFIP